MSGSSYKDLPVELQDKIIEGSVDVFSTSDLIANLQLTSKDMNQTCVYGINVKPIKALQEIQNHLKSVFETGLKKYPIPKQLLTPYVDGLGRYNKADFDDRDYPLRIDVDIKLDEGRIAVRPDGIYFISPGNSTRSQMKTQTPIKANKIPFQACKQFNEVKVVVKYFMEGGEVMKTTITPKAIQKKDYKDVESAFQEKFVNSSLKQADVKYYAFVLNYDGYYPEFYPNRVGENQTKVVGIMNKRLVHFRRDELEMKIQEFAKLVSS